MDIFLQQMVNGLTIGSLYALVALGYTMVYGVMRLINFAHGDLVAFSAFIGLSVYAQIFGESVTSLGAIIVVFALSALIVAFVGVLLERLAYRPLRTAPRLSAVVSALGAGLVIQNSVMLIWGPNMKIFPSNLGAIIVVFALSALIVAFVGVLLERLAYRPLRTAPRLSAVVSALGAGLVIQNSVMLIWGPNMKIFPSNLFPATIWEIGGIVITFTQVMILGVSSVLMVGLYFFIHQTKIGTAIRAVAIDQDAAKLMGINVNRIIMIIFIIGSALGAVAGLFIGSYYRGITFDMGWMYGLNAFVAAIMGGIGNIPGAMLGGLLLGLFNAMITGYISTQWAETFTFILLIAILVFRPTGILGETVAEKV